ncbi:GNAT family N-acetyltransferase [Brevifollis gellanilyticus]|uniref:GNAT family N-acetyltransferase n=1 Tax=Brevifollis gellanilyticus TaxID=748831 RepID=UPI0011BF5A0C|nr:GNAT family protein [Brevifollis gellanilyticus]
MPTTSFPSHGWPGPSGHTLAGQFITLKPLNIETDVEDLFAASAAGDIWRYMPAGPFADAAAMADWLRQWQGQPDVVAFTVVDNASARRMGSISLMRITPKHGVAELGCIWYAPDFQRTKANTEANYLLIRHCFQDLGYRRMEWKCDSRNERSRAAALRLGFRFEGIFHQHMVIKGENRDTAWFAMLDHDWLRIGAAMERWLYEEGAPSLRELTAESAEAHAQC